MAQIPVLAVDTHAAVVELIEAGMPERQAESVVRLQVRLIEQHFATRADIGAVNAAVDSLRLMTEANFESRRQETKADFGSHGQEFKARFESHGQEFKARFESHRQEFKADFELHRQETSAQFESFRLATDAAIASLKAELIKWMIGTNLAFAAFVIAAVKIL